MNLNSKESLIGRLLQGRQKRSQFVESHLGKGLAYQIRAIRDRLGWNQEKLAAEVGMPQNAVSRLESPNYGKPTLTTLKRLAAAFDVGLVVRFVPFSEMVDWESGTPRIQPGLSSETLGVVSFEEEERTGAFDVVLDIHQQRGTYESTMVGGNSKCVLMAGTGIGSVQIDHMIGSVPERKPIASSYLLFESLTSTRSVCR